MKRILIFSHSMELGGVERALIGLLWNIDYNTYSVDLFLMRHSGELMKDIPPQAILLPEVSAYASLAVPWQQVLKKRQFGIALGRWIGKKRALAFVKHQGLGENAVSLEYSHKYTRFFLPKIGFGEYDLAVSFLTPHYFVADKVKAKKKVAWIHTDYSQLAVDVDSEVAMWDRFNSIVAVSESVADSFCSVFPSLKNKVTVIENILPESLIRRQSGAFSTEEEMPSSTLRLLSIGRFSHAKNFDSIPEICANILAAGLDVIWYLIGYGGGEDLIRKKIAKTGMEKHVVILGKKENPYPYLAACDLYIQPSRYEGKAVTVREAQLLGKPVVVTAFPTACSQLEDGVDGIIVPMDVSGCANGIVSLLQDPTRLAHLKETCLQREYSYREEIEHLYQLF